MTQLLDKASMAATADRLPHATDNDPVDPRHTEKLLLGGVAVAMIAWLAFLGWLVWWLIT